MEHLETTVVNGPPPRLTWDAPPAIRGTWDYLNVRPRSAPGPRTPGFQCLSPVCPISGFESQMSVPNFEVRPRSYILGTDYFCSEDMRPISGTDFGILGTDMGGDF